MKRAVRYGAYVVAGLALLLVAAALIIPELLDRPKMAAEIQAKLSKAVGGEVRWEDFSLRILPSPHGNLRGLRVQTAAATLTTDDATIALRLWPLFLGRAEVASVHVAKPVLRLTVVPAASVPEEAQTAPPPKDPMAAYRSAMGGLASALQEFAPDTVVQVDDADVHVRIEGTDMPPIEVSKLRIRGRTSDHGVELDATATSRYWNALRLAARIEYAELVSTAELQLTRIHGKPWLDWLLKPSGIDLALPDVDLSLRFRGDAKKALQLDLEGAAQTLTLTRTGKRIDASPVALNAKLLADANKVAVQVQKLSAGATALAGGAVQYTPKDSSVTGDVGYELDLVQALGYARQFAPEPLARLDSLTGTLRGRIKVAMRDAWRLGVTVDKSDAAAQVKDLPGPIRLARAAVELDQRAVKVESAVVSMPAGELTFSNVRYGMKDRAAAAAVAFDLGLAPTLELVRAAMSQESRGSLDIVESADGRLQGSVKGTLAGKNWTAALQVAKSDAQVKLKGLPGPVTLTGASAHATPKAVTVDSASAKFLDLSATAKATITDYTGERMRVEAAVSEASIGPKLLAWVWQTAKIPASVEPRTPIGLAVSRFAWAPKAPVEVRADARFADGPVVSVDLGWSPGALDVRRAAIKDRSSDMSVSLRTKGNVIEGRYAGTLDSRSIGRMLKTAAAPSGALSGDLRFVIDRDERRRTSANGAVKGEGIDLSWLAGQPAKIERLDVTADGATLRIAEATVDWAGQRATMRGEARHGENGPVIQAQIESPGILVDALLPPKKPAAAKPPAGTQESAKVWPLPVTGKIGVRSAFVQYENYKVQPLRANVILEENKATLDVQEALLCGFAVPATVEATPQGLTVSAQIAAQKQKLDEAAQCLAGESVALSGALDLRVDVRTQGKPDELVRNLNGTVSADVRNGQMKKFALIGNILSMQNVVALAEQGGPKLGAEGFPFRQLKATGRFDKGRFMLDEGVFHSNAIGMGANGWISLTDYQTSLTVLVAPLALLDEGVRKIPLIGYVVGGTFTSLPVAVSGDIRDPRVVPLGPRAITNELSGILTRTFTLPGKVVAPK